MKLEKSHSLSRDKWGGAKSIQTFIVLSIPVVLGSMGPCRKKQKGTTRTHLMSVCVPCCCCCCGRVFIQLVLVYLVRRFWSRAFGERSVWLRLKVISRRCAPFRWSFLDGDERVSSSGGPYFLSPKESGRYIGHREEKKKKIDSSSITWNQPDHLTMPPPLPSYANVLYKATCAISIGIRSATACFPNPIDNIHTNDRGVQCCIYVRQLLRYYLLFGRHCRRRKTNLTRRGEKNGEEIEWKLGLTWQTSSLH